MVTWKSTEAGFSLAEIIVASALLSGALIFASAAAGGAAAAIGQAELDEGAIAAVERLGDSLLALPGVVEGEGARVQPPYRLGWRLGTTESAIDVVYDTSGGERKMHFGLRLLPPLSAVEP